MKTKFKKIITLVLSITMIMAMSITVQAAGGKTSSHNSKITVKGLVEQEETTVMLYQVVSLDAAENNWVIAEWAENLIKVKEDGTVGVNNVKEDYLNLQKAALNRTPEMIQKVKTTSCKFDNVPVGAYVVVATGTKATYSPMLANTYDNTGRYMAAKDVTVIAKTSGYSVDKTASDTFVAKGEKVTFTITTVYPTFLEPDNVDNSYQLIDQPTGLSITEVNSILIGNTAIDNSKYTNKYNDKKDQYIIDLTKTIGKDNDNAGKIVTVEYSASVTSNEGYKNTVNAIRNNVELGESETKGYTGSITLYKVNKAQEKLKGAEFSVNKGAVTDKENYLYFVQTKEGVYDLTDNKTKGATTTIVAVDGSVTIKGLDEGNYHFTETKAPSGYSVNKDGATVEISDKKDGVAVSKNVSQAITLEDAKLTNLPATGGIGTCIFTITGIAIMLVAAALIYFNRKKSKE